MDPPPQVSNPGLLMQQVNIFVLNIGIVEGKEDWIFTFQGFRLHPKESDFWKDLATHIKMLPLLRNYPMEMKCLFIGVCVKDRLLQNSLEWQEKSEWLENPSVGCWLTKAWFIHIVRHFAYFKNNNLDLHVIIWKGVSKVII